MKKLISTVFLCLGIFCHEAWTQKPNRNDSGKTMVKKTLAGGKPEKRNDLRPGLAALPEEPKGNFNTIYGGSEDMKAESTGNKEGNAAGKEKKPAKKRKLAPPPPMFYQKLVPTEKGEKGKSK